MLFVGFKKIYTLAGCQRNLKGLPDELKRAKVSVFIKTKPHSIVGYLVILYEHMAIDF